MQMQCCRWLRNICLWLFHFAVLSVSLTIPNLWVLLPGYRQTGKKKKASLRGFDAVLGFRRPVGDLGPHRPRIRKDQRITIILNNNVQVHELCCTIKSFQLPPVGFTVCFLTEESLRVFSWHAACKVWSKCVGHRHLPVSVTVRACDKGKVCRPGEAEGFNCAHVTFLSLAKIALPCPTWCALPHGTCVCVYVPRQSGLFLFSLPVQKQEEINHGDKIKSRDLMQKLPGNATTSMWRWLDLFVLLASPWVIIRTLNNWTFSVINIFFFYLWFSFWIFNLLSEKSM